MKSLYFIIPVLLILFAACQKNEVYGPSDQVTQIELNLNGLKTMGDSCWYEGWLIWGDDNENRESIGVFQVDEQGAMSQRLFNINLGTMQQVQKFLITIELDDVPGYQVTTNVTVDTVTYDSVAGPSPYQLMAGIFRGNSADLRIGTLTTFENEFTLATGTYILDTPTDSNRTNPESGIWFVDFDSLNAPIQSLQLPGLGGGWNYGGYVDIGGVVVPTGQFRNPAAADDENPFSDSTGAAYGFPGEDFLYNAPQDLTFPLDLSGSDVYIELTPPNPAGHSSPVESVVLLQATVPAGAIPQTVYELSNVVPGLPYGTAFLNIELYE